MTRLWIQIGLFWALLIGTALGAAPTPSLYQLPLSVPGPTLEGLSLWKLPPLSNILPEEGPLQEVWRLLEQGNPHLAVARAEAHLKRRDLSEEERSLARLLRAEGLFMTAWVVEREDLWKQVRDRYEDLLLEDPSAPWIPLVRLRLGTVYQHLGLLPEVQGMYLRMALEEPPSPWDLLGWEALIREALRNGRLPGAAFYLRRVFRTRPLHTMPPFLQAAFHFLQADLLYQVGEFADAQEAFEKGIQRWAGYLKSRPLFLFHYAQTLFQNGYWRRAQEGFATFYNLYPHHPGSAEALLRLADTHRMRRQSRPAKWLYQEVLNVFPDGDEAIEAHLHLGHLLEEDFWAETHPRKRDFLRETIWGHYQQVLQSRSPLASQAHLFMARFLKRSGDWEGALEHYSQALARGEQGSPVVHQARREARETLQARFQRALYRREDLEILALYQGHRDLFAFLPDQVNLLQIVAQAYRRVGLYAQAAALYRALQRTGNPRFLFLEGEALFQGGYWREALQRLQAFRVMYPDHPLSPVAGRWVVQGFFRQRAWEQGIAYLEQHRIAVQGFPRLALEVARAYARLGKGEKGQQVLKQVLASLDPKTPKPLRAQLWIALGDQGRELRRLEGAWKAYQEGSRLVPRESVLGTQARLLAARVLIQKGEAPEAQRVLEQISKEAQDPLLSQVARLWEAEMEVQWIRSLLP